MIKKRIARGVGSSAAISALGGVVAAALIGLAIAFAIAATPRPLTVVAAGDIACDATALGSQAEDASGQSCHMAATAQLIAAARPDLVLPLGDEQYQAATLQAFQSSYAKTWGRFLAISRPAVGNHEYGTPHAAGYFTYFGARAGDPSKGYYSFDRNRWHFIALNGNCGEVGGCAAGSPQEQWLKDDLARQHDRCILAYWHQPRFSSGPHHSDPEYEPFWQDLYAAQADLVLNGHDHDYERFGAQDAAGKTDARGVREFVVGTGGRSHYIFMRVEPNSEARNDTTFGVLVLHLWDNRYDWTFKPEAGKTFSDHGAGRCHLSP